MGTLAGTAHVLSRLVAEGRLPEAVGSHAQAGASKWRKDYPLRSVLDIKRCPCCGVKWAGFEVAKHENGSWEEIKELDFAQFLDTELVPLTATDR